MLGSALRSHDANTGPVHAIVASITGTAADDPAAAAAAIAADPALLETLRSAEAQSRADLVAYVLRTGGSRAAGPAVDAVRAQRGLWGSLGVVRNVTYSRNDERQRGKYVFMRPLLTAAVVLATILVVFAVLLGFADHALHDPSVAATAGCVLMYFMSEARLVTAYWFGATHDSKNADASAQLREVQERHERIEGREAVARETEGGVDERERDQKRIGRSALVVESPPAERSATGLFEQRGPRS
ncbi:hypothetical protein [Paraburkholderia solisilvae]|uniref:hypothetical protein n=1 Tax=Paraburkholderia solisilvae TaxID=624376 RepID=UPI0035ECA9B4